MEGSIREVVMGFLRRQNVPVTRAQVAAAMPDHAPNSINRMLRDMVKRGTVMETPRGFALAPLEQRIPMPSTRGEN